MIFVFKGGKDWILLTKGTDITESFETSHVFGVPQALLRKFWVKKATKPRTSRFTFDEDGFFKTVQRRGAVILRQVGTGPTLLSTLTIDILVACFAIIFCLLSVYPCMSIAFVAGRLLFTLTMCYYSSLSNIPGHGQCECSQLVPSV